MRHRIGVVISSLPSTSRYPLLGMVLIRVVDDRRVARTMVPSGNDHELRVVHIYISLALHDRYPNGAWSNPLTRTIVLVVPRKEAGFSRLRSGGRGVAPSSLVSSPGRGDRGGVI